MALIYLACVVWVAIAFAFSVAGAVNVKDFKRLRKWQKRQVVFYTWIVIGWFPAAAIFAFAKVIL